MVDEVVIGEDTETGLDFKSHFLRSRPALLVVTEDDKYGEVKRALCREVGAEYVVLPKDLDYDPISTTQIIRNIRTPASCPLRVDFAGGWLDVPRHARAGGFIVNCAVSPEVSLGDWRYRIGGGLGGSAAHALLEGRDAVESELDLGVGWQVGRERWGLVWGWAEVGWRELGRRGAWTGMLRLAARRLLRPAWRRGVRRPNLEPTPPSQSQPHNTPPQDPAVIRETGLCVWRSGPRPELDFKTSGAFLSGRMALMWTGSGHVTPEKADLARDYDAIEAAGAAARAAVMPGRESLPGLAAAVEASYRAQLGEGMAPLPGHGAAGRKYCGGGWGGYALYLFETPDARSVFLERVAETMAIEPFIAPGGTR
jgi:hypothetical protein